MRAWLVAGLGFGDEGKGAVVDWLVRQTGAQLVVRYNGGAQASHEVVTTDGRRHRAHQWSAGTLAGAHTYLGPEVVVDPIMLRHEAHVLREQGIADPWSRLTIDPRCPIVTPFHWAMNQIREAARGVARHGSCGMGIGEVREDVLTDQLDQILTAKRLAFGSRPMVRDTIRAIRAAREAEATRLCEEQPSLRSVPELTYAWRWMYADDLDGWIDEARQMVRSADVTFNLHTDTVVFEGAQGMLLDQTHGFQPHTSWTCATFTGAEAILADWPWTGEVARIGVVRAYCTRHGAGPMPTEDAHLSMRLAPQHGNHNGPSPWQGRLRVGHFDAVLTRHALDAIGGVDGLAVTCLDHVIGSDWRMAQSYRNADTLDRDTLAVAQPNYTWVGRATSDDICAALEHELDTQVMLRFTGPTPAHATATDALTAILANGTGAASHEDRAAAL